MRNVLMIAFDFPPMGGGAVMRISKFVNEYKPIILTTDKVNYDPVDKSLYYEVCKNKIYRVKNLNIYKKFSNKIKMNSGINKDENLEYIERDSIKLLILKKLKEIKNSCAKNFLIPDSSVIWARKAFKEAVNIIKNNNVDLIFVTSPPHGIQLLALKLKKEFPYIPLIIDFRDGWTINPLYKSSNKFKEKLEKIYEENLVKCANKIVCATEPIEKSYTIIYKKYASKFCTITNGYDGENYNFNRNNYIRNNKLVIMYTGSIGSKGVQAKYFLKACENIVKNREIKENLRIIFIGNFSEDKLYWSNKLNGNIEFKSLIPQKDIIEYTEKADLLMLTFTSRQGGKTVLTGKIFEYLAARRPILGLVPDSAAKDFILNNNLGFCCEPTNIRAIEYTIKKIYELWKNNQLYIKPDIKLIKKYDRKILTKKLAYLFDNLLNDKNKII